MGNNAEIRQRMNTYRSILLFINWIGSILGIIVGFILIFEIGAYTVIIIIVSIFLGIIGHFLINVALAIPFILLNNGAIMEKQNNYFNILLKSKNIEIPNEIRNNNVSFGNISNISGISGSWICKNCNEENHKSRTMCLKCGGNKI